MKNNEFCRGRIYPTRKPNFLNNKVALVTGGAKRIGKAISIALAQYGADVAINYLTSKKDALKTVQEIKNLGRNSIAVKADISNRKEVRKMIKCVISEFKKIDILINNAAIFYPVSFYKMTEKQWDEFMDINLKGTMFCSQLVLQEMIKKSSGKIINIGDIGGIQPWKKYIPYCVSKAGVVMLTKSMAKLFYPEIQVNCILPGKIIDIRGNNTGKLDALIKSVLLFSKCDKSITGKTVVVGGDTKL